MERSKTHRQESSRCDHVQADPEFPVRRCCRRAPVAINCVHGAVVDEQGDPLF